MIKQTIDALLFLGILLTLLMLVGWVKDISHLCKCDLQPPYKAEILYGTGAVLPPVGGIAGWFDEGK